MKSSISIIIYSFMSLNGSGNFCHPNLFASGPIGQRSPNSLPSSPPMVGPIRHWSLSLFTTHTFNCLMALLLLITIFAINSVESTKFIWVTMIIDKMSWIVRFDLPIYDYFFGVIYAVYFIHPLIVTKYKGRMDPTMNGQWKLVNFRWRKGLGGDCSRSP